MFISLLRVLAFWQNALDSQGIWIKNVLLLQQFRILFWVQECVRLCAHMNHLISLEIQLGTVDPRRGTLAERVKH